MTESPDIYFTAGLARISDYVHAIHSQRGQQCLTEFEDLYQDMVLTQEGRDALGGVSEKGATIGQAWNLFSALLGMYPICLVATGRKKQDTSCIRKTVLLSPATLLEYCVQAFPIGKESLVTFVWNGVKGHCINLIGYEPSIGSFIFDDGWPGAGTTKLTQLCTDVQPVEGGLWRISKTDLTRFVFAVFVTPTTWAELLSIRYKLFYKDIQGSPIFHFFNFDQVNNESLEDGSKILCWNGCSGFERFIFGVQLDNEDRIRSSNLLLYRRLDDKDQCWQIDLDDMEVISGYILSITPFPDHHQVERIAKALTTTSDETGTPLEADTDNIIMTHMGLQDSFTIFLTYCRIDGENIESDNYSIFRVGVELYSNSVHNILRELE